MIFLLLNLHHSLYPYLLDQVLTANARFTRCIESGERHDCTALTDAPRSASCTGTVSPEACSPCIEQNEDLPARCGSRRFELCFNFLSRLVSKKALYFAERNLALAMCAQPITTVLQNVSGRRFYPHVPLGFFLSHPSGQCWWWHLVSHKRHRRIRDSHFMFPGCLHLGEHHH